MLSLVMLSHTHSYPGSAVVEHTIPNPTFEGSNPAACTKRENDKNCLYYAPHSLLKVLKKTF